MDAQPTIEEYRCAASECRDIYPHVRLHWNALETAYGSFVAALRRTVCHDDENELAEHRRRVWAAYATLRQEARAFRRYVVANSAVIFDNFSALNERVNVPVIDGDCCCPESTGCVAIDDDNGDKYEAFKADRLAKYASAVGDMVSIGCGVMYESLRAQCSCDNFKPIAANYVGGKAPDRDDSCYHHSPERFALKPIHSSIFNLRSIVDELAFYSGSFGWFDQYGCSAHDLENYDSDLMVAKADNDDDVFIAVAYDDEALVLTTTGNDDNDDVATLAVDGKVATETAYDDAVLVATAYDNALLAAYDDTEPFAAIADGRDDQALVATTTGGGGNDHAALVDDVAKITAYNGAVLAAIASYNTVLAAYGNTEEPFAEIADAHDAAADDDDAVVAAAMNDDAVDDDAVLAQTVDGVALGETSDDDDKAFDDEPPPSYCDSMRDRDYSAARGY